MKLSKDRIGFLLTWKVRCLRERSSEQKCFLATCKVVKAAKTLDNFRTWWFWRESYHFHFNLVQSIDSWFEISSQILGCGLRQRHENSCATPLQTSKKQTPTTPTQSLENCFVWLCSRISSRWSRNWVWTFFLTRCTKRCSQIQQWLQWRGWRGVGMQVTVNSKQSLILWQNQGTPTWLHS